MQSTERTEASSVAVASSAHRPKSLQVCVPFIKKTQTNESIAKDYQGKQNTEKEFSNNSTQDPLIKQ